MRLGECERGTLCNFAHGLVELRKPPKDVVMVNINMMKAIYIRANLKMVNLTAMDHR